MKWVPVESSAFWAAAYEEDEHLLYLKFRSGEVYRYFDIPVERYREFLAADSKGRSIMSCSRASRLTDPEPIALTCITIAQPPACGILPQGAILHRKRLLIIGRNARVQAGSEHFRPSACLDKNVSDFVF